MQLILASRSPRRRMLLEQIGLRFETVPSTVDEAALQEQVAGLTPAEQVRAIARAKAVDVAERFPGAVVIGADTVVALDGGVLGKPADAAEAAAMLRRLSGRCHSVWTGVAVCTGSRAEPAVLAEETRVCFRSLSDAEIRAYVATGEPLDKAGAYGIQGRGAVFVDSVRGCYFNVVGLPLARIFPVLTEAGCDIITAWEREREHP